MRTIPGISHLLKPLDDVIILSLVLMEGYAFNPTERALLPLPAKYVQMELIFPSELCQEEHENSREITKESSNKVIRNEIQFQDNCVSTPKIKNNTKNQKKKLNDAKLQEVTKH